MRPDTDVHDALARLLLYPDPDFAANLTEWMGRVRDGCPEAAEHLDAWRAFVGDQSVSQLEELYTRTFDNTTERALEVGWHVFGENYTRGAYMVRMRELLRETGAPQTSELPDHLGHVLGIVARCDPDYASELVTASVLPATEKITLALTADENPYAHVLRAVLAVLARHAAQPAMGG